MNVRLMRAMAAISLSLAGAAGLGYVLLFDPSAGIQMAVPGMDGRPRVAEGGLNPVRIGEFFRSSDGVPSSFPFSWPRFRGASLANTSSDSVPIAAQFGPGEPRVLWSVDLGEGHAGAAVDAGAVYVLDYDERRQADALRAFSLDDGREIWRRWYTVRIKRNHGISRTIPSVGGGKVVTLGPHCHLMCVDAATGELAWGVDLVARFGGEVPLWYTGQCPLIDGSQVVVATGGGAIMAGLDLETGSVLWQTPNPADLRASHSSIMLMTVGGARTYVYAAIGAIVGVSAESGDRGRLLWENRDFDARVIAPSPVAAGEDRIFCTAGYGAGSIMLSIGGDGGGSGSLAATAIYKHRPTDGFACEQQTPVIFQGNLFGIMPKDAGPLREQLVCWDPDGSIVWASGESNRFGLGPYLVADGKLVILNDDGVLTIAEATTRGYHPLATAKILDGPDAWAPMAIAGGLLIARDTHRMVCVDIRGEVSDAR